MRRRADRDAGTGQRLHRPATSTTGRSSTTDGEKHDRLTIHDYLWRWDTDWFWCSRAFGAQNPTIRRFWPRRYRRSSFYWKLIGYDQRFDIADRIEKRNGRPPLERVVQDVEVPIERTRRVPRLVPGRTCRSSRSGCARCGCATTASWPLYPIRPHHTYVNVGFWSSVPVGPEDGHTNKLIERKVSELDGHKSLYSDAFYSQEEFDELYGGETYKTVKKSIRPRFTSPRPVCEGGATAMTTYKEQRDDDTDAPEQRKADPGRDPGDLRRGSRLPLKFTAYDGSTRRPRRRRPSGWTC